MPRPVPPLTMPVAPTVVPSTIVAAPVAPPAPVVDSTPSGFRVTSEDIARRSLTDAIAKRYIPVFAPSPATANRAGAAMAPAGVTAHNAPLSVAARDSIVTAKLADAALWLSDKYKPTDEDNQRHAQQAEPAAPLPGTRAAGAAPLMNGGAAVRGVPILTISAPLFTRKPLPPETPEQRALRLRIQDRAIALRDSIRADSIEKARIRP